MDHAKILSKRHRMHMKLARKACDAVGGSQTKLAEAMGEKTRQGHVTQWLRGHKLVSPHKAVLMENAVRCAVTREQFYPELYENLVRIVTTAKDDAP